MKITKIGFMDFKAQDGALFNNYLFRFDSDGHCRIFDASLLHGKEFATLPMIADFYVDSLDIIKPHFNAVVFGNEKFEEGDEFPLLYANVYNNYANEEDRLCGTLCAYRVKKTGNNFSLELVQVIKTGFTDDSIWRSEDTEDIRPYGNFVIDREKSLIYAFTMRDGEHKTRYFTLPLPKKGDGEISERFGVPTAVLEKADIISYFDTEYHNFIQGAVCHGGLVYSSEGFDEKIHPALRVIDPSAKRQLAHLDLVKLGYSVEAEWIDFLGERCIYSDVDGNIYEAEFDI